MIISGLMKKKRKNKIIFCIMLLISLTLFNGCTSNTKYKLISNNDHYEDIYDVKNSELELIQTDFNTVLEYEKAIPDEKYIMVFLRESCKYSKQFLNQFIDHYNKNNYSFKKIYIFELDDYVVKDNEKATKENREKFLKKFDIQSVPVTLCIKDGKIFNTEVGFYPENILIEVISEFEKK